MKLAGIEPQDIKQYAKQLEDRGLTRRASGTRSHRCGRSFATAFEQGVMRSNPAAGVRIAHEVDHDQGEEHAKALTEDELSALLEQHT